MAGYVRGSPQCMSSGERSDPCDYECVAEGAEHERPSPNGGLSTAAASSSGSADESSELSELAPMKQVPSTSQSARDGERLMDRQLSDGSSLMDMRESDAHGDAFGKTFSFTRTFDPFEPGSPMFPVKSRRSRNLHACIGSNGDKANSDCGATPIHAGASTTTTDYGSATTADYSNFGATSIDATNMGWLQTPESGAPDAFSHLASHLMESPMGNQHAFMMMTPPASAMPLPCAHGGWQQPPMRPAPPPGAWGPSPVAPSLAEPEGQSLRLVRAARQPPPLNHNKSVPVTSLTVNHIPWQVRRTQLCVLLDETGFASRYDYVYVPCNKDKTNRGHAFVNFCSEQDARDFFSVWHGARVMGSGGDAPILSVAVSVIQGFQASIQRWTVGKMLAASDADFQPFIRGMVGGGAQRQGMR